MFKFPFGLQKVYRRFHCGNFFFSVNNVRLHQIKAGNVSKAEADFLKIVTPGGCFYCFNGKDALSVGKPAFFVNPLNRPPQLFKRERIFFLFKIEGKSLLFLSHACRGIGGGSRVILNICRPVAGRFRARVKRK